MNKVLATIILTAIFLIAMLLETTIVVLPLVYLFGAFLLIFFRRIRIYILVFLLAFFIDSLRVTNFGLTAIFLVALCSIIFIYERYSGSDDRVVSSTVICASAIIYAHYLSYSVAYTTVFILMSAGVTYAIYTFNRRGKFLV